jgi:hypothetical protein
MPIISFFFGIIIRMFYFDHHPPHIHAEFQGNKAILDFRGNILKGDLQSRTATKLLREWIDLRHLQLLKDWDLAKEGKEIECIDPLE